MSSYYNLYSVSRTLANQIWNGIKDDKHLRTIITSEGQIIHDLPKLDQNETAQISVFLYSVNEIASLRNQPQPTANPQEPRTLLNLNLRYLITPLTFNAENDQVIIGKIMQLFAEKPVLRGTELQGSLQEENNELKILLDDIATDDMARIWNSLKISYHFSLSYSVYPVQIKESAKQKTETTLTIPPKELELKQKPKLPVPKKRA